MVDAAYHLPGVFAHDVLHLWACPGTGRPFRRVNPLVDKASGQPLVLEDLTCVVQLQVPGVKVDPSGNNNDESLVVPTGAKGPTWLTVTPVQGRGVVFDAGRSVKV
jgi:hypothetical protein